MSATSDRSVIVGVDVGGTKVLAGVVSEDGRVGHTAARDTPARPTEAQDVEDALVGAVLDAAGGRPLAGVGLAAAGLVDVAGERVMFAPHLPWREEPLRQRLTDRLGASVALDNDATCAVLGEWSHGAARGTESALVVTLGTGIGGGIVIGGRLVRGAHGMAGEFGHMQVVPGGEACECGQRGCWEQYCSGRALTRWAASRVGSEPTLLEQACNGDPTRVTGPIVTLAAEQGDPMALRAFGIVGEWLGIGLANLIAAFDPQVIVVGGGVSAAGELILGPARDTLARSVVAGAYRSPPSLLVASLGPRAGLIGAAIMVREQVRAQSQD